MSDTILVALRLRPFISREKLNEEIEKYWEARDNCIVQLEPTSKKQINSFAFDKVFDESISNEKIYNDLAHPIVHSGLAGFNGTIFAYGQTASGKTYTMTGTSSTLGIIPLAIQNLFNSIENMPDREFLLRASYMEIYQENIYDLLTGGKIATVREDSQGQVTVLGLKEVCVINEDMLLEVMSNGDKRRKVGETNMNERSSRSHSIFRLIIESKERGDKDCQGAISVSHLNLVDLAGSENVSQTGAVGERLKEGGSINKSLFMLGRVISQLSEGEQHINFRDSKLTRILQNSLGGNAKTAIICTVTPANKEQTLSTVRFACRAKNIKNKPIVNEVISDAALLKRYALEIKRLRHALDNERKTDKAQEMEQVKEKLDEQEKQNLELNEKIIALKEKLVVSSHPHVSSNAVDLKKRRMTWAAPVFRKTLRMSVTPYINLGMLKEDSEFVLLGNEGNAVADESIEKSISQLDNSLLSIPEEETALTLNEIPKINISTCSFEGDPEVKEDLLNENEMSKFLDDSFLSPKAVAPRRRKRVRFSILPINRFIDVACQTEEIINIPLSSNLATTPTKDASSPDCLTPSRGQTPREILRLRIKSLKEVLDTKEIALHEWQEEIREIEIFHRNELQEAMATYEEQMSLEEENIYLKKSLEDSEGLYLEVNKRVSEQVQEIKTLKDQINSLEKERESLLKQSADCENYREEVLKLRKELKEKTAQIMKFQNEKNDYDMKMELALQKQKDTEIYLRKSLEDAWEESSQFEKDSKAETSQKKSTFKNLEKELQKKKEQLDVIMSEKENLSDALKFLEEQFKLTKDELNKMTVMNEELSNEIVSLQNKNYALQRNRMDLKSSETLKFKELNETVFTCEEWSPVEQTCIMSSSILSSQNEVSRKLSETIQYLDESLSSGLISPESNLTEVVGIKEQLCKLQEMILNQELFQGIFSQENPMFEPTPQSSISVDEFRIKYEYTTDIEKLQLLERICEDFIQYSPNVYSSPPVKFSSIEIHKDFDKSLNATTSNNKKCLVTEFSFCDESMNLSLYNQHKDSLNLADELQLAEADQTIVDDTYSNFPFEKESNNLLIKENVDKDSSVLEQKSCNSCFTCSEKERLILNLNKEMNVQKEISVSLQAEVKILHTREKELENKLNIKSGKEKDLENELNEIKKRENELTRDLHKTENDLKNMKFEMEAIKQQNSCKVLDMETKANELLSHIEKLKEKEGEYLNELNELREKEEEVESMIIEFLDKEKLLEEKENQFSKETKHLKDELLEKSNIISDLKSKIVDYERQLEKLKSQESNTAKEQNEGCDPMLKISYSDNHVQLELCRLTEDLLEKENLLQETEKTLKNKIKMLEDISLEKSDTIVKLELEVADCKKELEMYNTEKCGSFLIDEGKEFHGSTFVAPSTDSSFELEVHRLSKELLMKEDLLKEKEREFMKKVASFEDDLKEKFQTISNLNSELADSKKELEMLRTEKSAYVNGSEKENQSSSTEVLPVSDLEEIKIRKLTEEKEALQKELEIFQEIISSLELEASTKEVELDHIKQELNLARCNIKDLTTLNNSVKDKLKYSETLIESLQEEIFNLKLIKSEDSGSFDVNVDKKEKMLLIEVGDTALLNKESETKIQEPDIVYERKINEVEFNRRKLDKDVCLDDSKMREIKEKSKEDSDVTKNHGREKLLDEVKQNDKMCCELNYELENLRELCSKQENKISSNRKTLEKLNKLVEYFNLTGIEGIEKMLKKAFSLSNDLKVDSTITEGESVKCTPKCLRNSVYLSPSFDVALEESIDVNETSSISVYESPSVENEALKNSSSSSLLERFEDSRTATMEELDTLPKTNETNFEFKISESLSSLLEKFEDSRTETIEELDTLPKTDEPNYALKISNCVKSEREILKEKTQEKPAKESEYLEATENSEILVKSSENLGDTNNKNTLKYKVLEEEMNSKRKEIDLLVKQIEECKRNILSLEELNEKLKSELNCSKETIVILSKELDHLKKLNLPTPGERSVSIIEKDIKVCEGKDSEIKRLSNIVKDLEAVIEAKDKEHVILNEKVEKIEIILRLHNMEGMDCIEKALSEKAYMSVKLTEMNQDCNTLREKVVTLVEKQETMDILLVELDELKKAFDEKVREESNMIAEIKERMDTIVKKDNEIKVHKETIDYLKSDNEEMNTNNKSLMEKLNVYNEIFKSHNFRDASDLELKLAEIDFLKENHRENDEMNKLLKEKLYKYDEILTSYELKNTENLKEELNRINSLVVSNEEKDEKIKFLNKKLNEMESLLKSHNLQDISDLDLELRKFKDLLHELKEKNDECQSLKCEVESYVAVQEEKRLLTSEVEILRKEKEISLVKEEELKEELNLINSLVLSNEEKDEKIKFLSKRLNEIESLLKSHNLQDVCDIDIELRKFKDLLHELKEKNDECKSLKCEIESYVVLQEEKRLLTLEVEMMRKEKEIYIVKEEELNKEIVALREKYEIQIKKLENMVENLKIEKENNPDKERLETLNLILNAYEICDTENLKKTLEKIKSLSKELSMKTQECNDLEHDMDILFKDRDTLIETLQEDHENALKDRDETIKTLETDLDDLRKVHEECAEKGMKDTLEIEKLINIIEKYDFEMTEKEEKSHKIVKENEILKMDINDLNSKLKDCQEIETLLRDETSRLNLELLDAAERTKTLENDLKELSVEYSNLKEKHQQIDLSNSKLKDYQESEVLLRKENSHLKIEISDAAEKIIMLENGHEDLSMEHCNLKDKYQIDINDLNLKLKTCIESESLFRDENSRLKTELLDASEGQQALEKDLKDLSIKYNDLKDNHQMEISNLNSKLKDCQENEALFRGENNRLETKLLDASGRIEVLEKELKDLNVQYNNLKGNQQIEISDLNLKLKDYQKSEALLKKENSRLKTELLDTTGRLKVLEKDLTDQRIEHDLKHKHQPLAGNEETVHLIAKLNSLESEKVSLNSDVENLKKQLNEEKEKNKALDEELDNLDKYYKGIIEGYSFSLRGLKEKNKTFNESLKQCEKMHTTNRESLPMDSVVDSTNISNSGEINNLKSEIKKLSNLVSKLREENESLKSCKQMRTTNYENVSIVTDIDIKNSSNFEEIHNLKLENKKLADLVSKLQKEIELLQQELQNGKDLSDGDEVSLREQIFNLKKDNNVLKIQLQAMQAPIKNQVQKWKDELKFEQEKNKKLMTELRRVQNENCNSSIIGNDPSSAQVKGLSHEGKQQACGFGSGIVLDVQVMRLKNANYHLEKEKERLQNEISSLKGQVEWYKSKASEWKTKCYKQEQNVQKLTRKLETGNEGKNISSLNQTPAEHKAINEKKKHEEKKLNPTQKLKLEDELNNKNIDNIAPAEHKEKNIEQEIDMQIYGPKCSYTSEVAAAAINKTSKKESLKETCVLQESSQNTPLQSDEIPRHSKKDLESVSASMKENQKRTIKELKGSDECQVQ